MIGAFLAKYAVAGLGVALALSLAAGGVQTLRLYSTKAALSDEKAARQKERADAEETARHASENYRRQEAELRGAVLGAQNDLDTERAKNQAALASARTDADGLRKQLSTFARGSQTADNTCAPERERAATLGVLLADSLQAHAVCTGAVENHASEVRSLLNAWPKGTP